MAFCDGGVTFTSLDLTGMAGYVLWAVGSNGTEDFVGVETPTPVPSGPTASPRREQQSSRPRHILIGGTQPPDSFSNGVRIDEAVRSGSGGIV